MALRYSSKCHLSAASTYQGHRNPPDCAPVRHSSGPTTLPNIAVSKSQVGNPDYRLSLVAHYGLLHSICRCWKQQAQEYSRAQCFPICFWHVVSTCATAPCIP